MDYDMDLARSFVHPAPKGTPSFDFLLTTHLMKNADFRPHDFSKYFYNFFLGFVFMIPETALFYDLHIEQAYWKLMPENVGAKFVFFTRNIDNLGRRTGKLTMQVRNVFFDAKFKLWKRGITSDEYDFLRKSLDLIHKDIDDCDRNIEEYAVKGINMYKDGRLNSRRRMPVIIQKLKTDPRMISTKYLENAVAAQSPILRALVVPEFAKLRQLVIDEFDQTIKPLEYYLSAMKTSDREDYIPNVKQFFGLIAEMYEFSRLMYGVEFPVWNGADCGFMHGALSSLGPKGHFVPKVTHTIVLPEFDNEEAGLVGRFYLSIQQKFVEYPKHFYNIRMYSPPITMSFVQDINGERFENMRRLDWTMLERYGEGNGLSSQKLLLQINYQMGQTKIMAAIRGKLVHEVFLTNLRDFHDTIMMSKTNQDKSDLQNFITNTMNLIMHTGSTCDVEESKNYLSKYFLGSAISMRRGRDKNELSIYVSKNDRSDETTFFVKSNIKPMNIILKFIEKEMKENPIREEIDANEILNRIVVSDLKPEDGDLIVITVNQEYQHTKDDFIRSNNVDDLINRDISIAYKKFDPNHLEAMDLLEIEHFAIHQSVVADPRNNMFNMDVQRQFSKYADLIGSKYSYKAFVDGLFFNFRHFKLQLPMRPFYSIGQLAFPYSLDNIEKYNVVNFMYSDEQDGGPRIKTALAKMASQLQQIQGDFWNVNFNKANGRAVVNYMRPRVNALEGCFPFRRFRQKRDADCDLLKEEEDKISIEDTEVAKEIPRARIALGNLHKFASGIMTGLMIRDLIADIVRGDVGSALTDASFIGGSLVSHRLALSAESYAAKLLENGKFVMGTSLRAAAPILRRVTSAYVLTHLISSINAYQKDKNDTSSVVDIATDSIFLGIDVIETGVEVMELFGVIEGVSSVTGPIGMAIGALLLIGSNIYSTVKTMKHINEQIHLNFVEEVDETFRSFLHLNPEEHIQNLLNEHEANEFIMNKIVTEIRQRNSIKYYITQAGSIINGKFAINNDTIIDLRSNNYFVPSRANPKETQNLKLFCKLPGDVAHHEQEVKKSKSFWEKISSGFDNFVWNVRAFVDSVRGDFKATIMDVAHVNPGDYVTSYTCYQSFGVVNYQSTSNNTLFDLGSGFDKVHGFVDKPNIFNISDGQKEIYGGSDNDIFIINGERVIGMLVGAGGNNKLDLHNYHIHSVLNIDEHTVSYKLNNQNLTLITTDMNEIIGRPNQRDIVTCSCHHRNINSNGGKSMEAMDEIIVEDTNCSTYDAIFKISSFTHIRNMMTFGNFTYLINPDSSSNIHIHATGNDSVSHKISFPIDILELKTLVTTLINGTTCLNVEISWKSGSVVILELCDELKSFQIFFNDGSQLIVKPGHSVVLLKSQLTIEAIVNRYDTFLRTNGLSMVAYSLNEGRSITFNHGKYSSKNAANETLSINVVHSDPIHESHVICSNGNNIILMQRSLSDDMSTFYIPLLTVDHLTRTLGQTVIDFSTVSSNIAATWPNVELTMSVDADLNSNDVFLSLSLTNSSSLESIKIIGRIVLREALQDQAYENVKIINYGPLLSIVEQKVDENVVLSYEISKKANENGTHIVNSNATLLHYKSKGQPSIVLGYQHGHIGSDYKLVLIPEQQIFDQSSDLIYVTSQNVESGQKIQILKRFENYNYYRINDTLLITNAFEKLMWDHENSCSIMFIDYFLEPKLKSLKVSFMNGVVIKLSKVPNRIDDVSDLWNKIVVNDRFFYSY